MSDDAHIELEALQATYTGAVTVASDSPLAVQVALAPRGCPLTLSADAKKTSTALSDEPSPAAEARCFVRAALLLTCGSAYPEQPPAIQLQHVRGAHHEQSWDGYCGLAVLTSVLRRPTCHAGAIPSWCSCCASQ